ncbi:carbohydrate ABC transporter permease [Leadbettera azotonutricia]|uniref:Sugar ABC transporter, permease protein n=1 Tax=Leadbettera azotonutricia (strain ATCC BAA-888 / DSM 13862 / ZAS-9) TaxID=545695 RepID=F5YF22_LEAAZ|nr:carbohydrate ABC transporter permease [Leadbettera azotonutricia]AEF83209.1 sugar ABC transporter, permease protein [Leadbettera azotonutricia ZAS-9]
MTHKGQQLLKRISIDAFFYVFMTLIAVLMIVPFLWMLSTSFKEMGQVLVFPPQWIPKPFLLENYTEAWKLAKLDLYFRNSVIITIFTTVGQIITCSLAGFAFARLEFRGRNALFLLYLATMMIPIQVTLIPLYLLMKSFGWINTFAGIIMPGIFSAWGTFLLRQFFMGIPKSLDESAVIDGCGYFRIYTTIIMPLSKPALATLSVFCFMWQWNNLLWPLVIANSDAIRPLTVGLQLFKGQFHIEWNLLMAGSMISVVPILVLYVFLQKYFVEGIALTGIKG